jgi:hypothetical protein
MTTKYFVKLVVERECYTCNGTGIKKPNPEDGLTVSYGEQCLTCKGTKKLWHRLAYTHAKSYEEALTKLMARLSQRWGLAIDEQYFLVWDKKTKTAPINVSRAVVCRLKRNTEREVRREFRRRNRI